MSQKTWTFTTYKDGKPVATEEHVDHVGALARVRAAIVGDEQLLDDLMAERKAEHPATEFAHAAFLARAA